MGNRDCMPLYDPEYSASRGKVKRVTIQWPRGWWIRPGFDWWIAGEGGCEGWRRKGLKIECEPDTTVLHPTKRDYCRTCWTRLLPCTAKLQTDSPLCRGLFPFRCAFGSSPDEERFEGFAYGHWDRIVCQCGRWYMVCDLYAAPGTSFMVYVGEEDDGRD